MTEGGGMRGVLERLVPVLRKEWTEGVVLVPLAIASGQPGKEILHPLAVVVLGGILFSTLLDQIVRPALFFKFGKPTATRIFAEREAKAAGREDWAAEEERQSRDSDVPPFGERMPDPVRD